MPGMSTTALRAEIKARGFDYLTDARVDIAIDSALSKIADAQRWPVLRTSTSIAAAGTQITRLQAVERVLHTPANESPIELSPTTDQEIEASGQLLTETGTPTHFYITGEDTVKLWPVPATGTTKAYHWSAPQSISALGNQPFPTRYDELVIDGALAYLEKDRQNWEAAAALRDEFNLALERMRDAMLTQQHAGNDSIQITQDWA